MSAGLWFDPDRDGFATGGTDDPSHPLARGLPEGGSTSSDDFTTDLISVTIVRKADTSGGSPVGSMTCLVKNTAGKYNPDNAASPVFGKIKPGMPGWFGVTDLGTLSGGSTVYGRFGGYLNTCAPIPQAGPDDAPKAELIFDDAFGRWRDAKARVAFSTSRTVATYRQAILAAINETRMTLATESDPLAFTGELGVSSQTVSGSTNALRILRFKKLDISSAIAATLATVRKPSVTKVLSVLEELNAITGTQHFIAPADTPSDWYTYTTVNRSDRLDDAPSAALTGTSDVSDTSGYVDSIDGVENAMSVEARPYRVDAQSQAVWQHPSVPFGMDPGQAKVVVADFGDIVFDASLSITSTLGSVVASAVYYGTGAVVQLTTLGPDTVTDITIMGRAVQRLDPILVEKSDASSANSYGERQGPTISSDLLTSEGMAEGIAAYHLWANSQPRKTPSVTIYNRFSTVLPLDLYDIVTLTVDQLDVSAKRFEIVGITETWTHAASNLQLAAFTLDLRETTNPAALSMFKIGVSTLGGSDGLAP